MPEKINEVADFKLFRRYKIQELKGSDTILFGTRFALFQFKAMFMSSLVLYKVLKRAATYFRAA
jgi:hypothetical protein